ncbi:MAG TPA: hypothetical protein VKV02_00975 [Acidobacteriaceae bacterium]|nr:hypothetical protein [Acidobacteriaceae bacterium]
MNANLILNIIAVVVSFVALAVSAIIASRQTKIMYQSNQVPLFVELFQEFRSERFQLAESHILDELESFDPAEGVMGLPGDIRSDVNVINNYFGTLGSLIIYGILEEREVMTMIGPRADRLWGKLEPFIIAERGSRGSDDFASFFEDLVYRVRLHWPLMKSYGLEIHRLEHLPGENQSVQNLSRNGILAKIRNLMLKRRRSRIDV